MAKVENIWGNAIVGHGEVNPESLLANERNWRTHPGFQREVVEEALERIGWIQTVVVNRRSGEEWGRDRGVETMVDGHLRVELALARGVGMIPVTYVDLSPDEEELALLLLDPTAGLAGADEEILRELLDEAGDLENSPVLDTMFELMASEWGVSDEPVSEEVDQTLDDNWQILIDCKDEYEQAELLERLLSEGVEAHALIG